LSLIANQSEVEGSFTNQSMLSYQVGEVDENGFVCIGIEERKTRDSCELNKTMGGSESGSDYSSSEEYSSGFTSDGSKSRNS